MKCVFCDIVKGKKAFKIYEDESVMSFLDVDPVSDGHSLVVTKKHFENIYDITDSDLKNLIFGVKKVSKILMKKLNVNSVQIINSSGIQQDVPHIHFHIVPRKEKDGLNLWYSTKKKINLKKVWAKLQ